MSDLHASLRTQVFETHRRGAEWVAVVIWSTPMVRQGGVLMSDVRHARVTVRALTRRRARERGIRALMVSPDVPTEVAIDLGFLLHL